MKFTVTTQEYIISVATVYTLNNLRWFTNINGNDQTWVNNANPDLANLQPTFYRRTKITLTYFNPFSWIELINPQTLKTFRITGTLNGNSTGRLYSETNDVNIYKSRNWFFMDLDIPDAVIPYRVDYATLPTSTGTQVFFTKMIAETTWL